MYPARKIMDFQGYIYVYLYELHVSIVLFGYLRGCLADGALGSLNIPVQSKAFLKLLAEIYFYYNF